MKTRTTLNLGIVALAASMLVPSSYAQSQWSQSIVGTANQGSYIYNLDFAHTNDSSQIQASAARDFTGLDREGNSQTMGFTGTTRTQSSYGRLHSYTAGAVTNSYYNESNAEFYNSTTGQYNENGSPTSLISLGFAGFTDILQFGGTLEAGYKARYLFHLHGFASGHGVLADLGFRVDSNPSEVFFETGSGSISTTWATQTYDVNGITPQTVDVQFSTQFVVDTFGVPDGSNLSGVGDFMSTLTLAGIQMVDSNGNLVDGWTVTAASGTQYARIVPEPMTCTVFAAGALGFLARRGRKRG